MDHENGFFGKFYKYLKEQSMVENLIKIPEAQVPLIKMKIYQTDFDLLLCSKKEGEPLDSVDGAANKKSTMSLQGYECSQNIEKIATRYGISTFRQVTKILKEFCKKRGIYGANNCYFNGMSL